MCLAPVRVINKRTHEIMYVPCGTCAECCEKIRNSWSKRISDTIKASCMPLSNHYGEMYAWFLTLTYDNEHLPLQTEESIIDDGLGEIRTPYTTRVYKDFSKFDALEAWKNDEDYESGFVTESRERIRYKSVSPDGIHGFLERKPLTDFFKRLRKIMDKYYHVKLQYFACGEYGGDEWDDKRKTHGTTRPHYHVLIWLNSKDEVNEELKGYYIKYDKRAFFHRIVPPLNVTTFRSIALKCWGQCKNKAFTCEPVRNIDATTRYCTKYILKANESKKQRFGYCVQRCPMFRTYSLNIGLEGAMKYLNLLIDEYRDGIVSLPTYRKFVIKNGVGEYVNLALPPYYFRKALKTLGYKFDDREYIENDYLQTELHELRMRVRELWQHTISSLPEPTLEEQIEKRSKAIQNYKLTIYDDYFDDVSCGTSRPPYNKHIPEGSLDDFAMDNPYCMDSIIMASQNLDFVTSMCQKRYIDDDFEVDIEIPF